MDMFIFLPECAKVKPESPCVADAVQHERAKTGSIG
jgi:hypothetical protein